MSDTKTKCAPGEILDISLNSMNGLIQDIKILQKSATDDEDIEDFRNKIEKVWKGAGKVRKDMVTLRGVSRGNIFMINASLDGENE